MGKSPFHTSGLVYQGAREFFDQEVPGGSSAVREGLNGELRIFFEQTFLASSMYDVLPMVPISHVAASLAKVSWGDLVRKNARFVAERDIRGVYKLLLNVLSPETVAMRLPKAAMRYFDFGKATAEMLGPGQCRLLQSGIPKAIAGWFIGAVDGFGTVALGKAGAKGVTLSAVLPQPDPRNPETVSIRFDFTWQP